jgi:hypothetical protein
LGGVDASFLDLESVETAHRADAVVVKASKFLPAAGVEQPGLAAEEQGREDGADVELRLGLLGRPSGPENAPGRSEEFVCCCESVLDGAADLPVAVAEGPEVDVRGVCGKEAAFFVDWDWGCEGGLSVVGVVFVDPVVSPCGGVCGRSSDAVVLWGLRVDSFVLSVEVVASDGGLFVFFFFSSFVVVGSVEDPGPVVVEKLVSFP